MIQDVVSMKRALARDPEAIWYAVHDGETLLGFTDTPIHRGGLVSRALSPDLLKALLR